MTHRIEQSESLMHRTIAEVLQRDVSDPRIVGLVGVTRVSITTDYRWADVYVTVMPDRYERRTLNGLNAAAAHIHRKVMKKVALRTVPHLRFALDKKVKNQAAVEEAIQQGLTRTQARSTDTDTQTDSPQDSPR